MDWKKFWVTMLGTAAGILTVIVILRAIRLGMKMAGKDMGGGGGYRMLSGGGQQAMPVGPQPNANPVSFNPANGIPQQLMPINFMGSNN